MNPSMITTHSQRKCVFSTNVEYKTYRNTCNTFSLFLICWRLVGVVDGTGIYALVKILERDIPNELTSLRKCNVTFHALNSSSNHLSHKTGNTPTQWDLQVWKLQVQMTGLTSTSIRPLVSTHCTECLTSAWPGIYSHNPGISHLKVQALLYYIYCLYIWFWGGLVFHWKNVFWLNLQDTFSKTFPLHGNANLWM